MKKAEKYTKTEGDINSDNESIEKRYYTIRHLDITDYDFELIREQIMDDDYEICINNGLIVNDDDFIFLECDNVLKYIKLQLEIKKIEYNESLDDWTYGDRLKYIIEVLENNKGFIINY